jgi:hypothetical protein
LHARVLFFFNFQDCALGAQAPRSSPPPPPTRLAMSSSDHAAADAAKIEQLAKELAESTGGAAHFMSLATTLGDELAKCDSDALGAACLAPILVRLQRTLFARWDAMACHQPVRALLDVVAELLRNIVSLDENDPVQTTYTKQVQTSARTRCLLPAHARVAARRRTWTTCSRSCSISRSTWTWRPGSPAARSCSPASTASRSTTCTRRSWR